MIDSYGRSLYQKALVDRLLPVFSTLLPITLTSFALFFCACGMLVVSGFLDTMDGSVARLKNQTSPFGAALDITSDRIVEFSVIFGLYFFDPENRALSCFLMLGSILFCVTSFLVVGIFTQNSSEKSFHYSLGLMERAEAFIFSSFLILLPGYFIPKSTLFSGLVFLTGVYRLRQFKKSTLPNESALLLLKFLFKKRRVMKQFHTHNQMIAKSQ